MSEEQIPEEGGEEESTMIEARPVANPNRTVITTETIGGGVSAPEQNKRFQ